MKCSVFNESHKLNVPQVDIRRPNTLKFYPLFSFFFLTIGPILQHNVCVRLCKKLYMYTILTVFHGTDSHSFNWNSDFFFIHHTLLQNVNNATNLPPHFYKMTKLAPNVFILSILFTAFPLFSPSGIPTHPQRFYFITKSTLPL